MAAKDYILIAPRAYESADPLDVAVDGLTGLAIGMSGQIDGFGAAKMPQLVIEGQAGTTCAMKEYEFYPQFAVTP